MPELTNKLALGTANFGLDYGVNNINGHLPENQAHKILQLALSSGITALDTAAGYGNSEEVIGKFYSSTLKVVTKLGRIPVDTLNIPEYIEDQVDKSLRLLNRQSVYGLLLHSPDQLSGPMGPQIIKTLGFLKATDRIQKVGMSIYSTEILDYTQSYFLPDIVQAPFNLFDQRLLTSGWATKLLSKNVEIHLRSTFLQGLLAKPISTLPKKFSRWQRNFAEFEEWQTKTGVSRVALALNFCLSQPWANKVIVGVDSSQQLADLIKMSGISLPKLPKSLANGVDDDLLINPTNWGTL